MDQVPIPFPSGIVRQIVWRNGRDAMSLTEIESYRELIQENIGYECSVCGKRLLMQSAQIRMTTLIDYTSKVKNLALLAVVYQNFSLQCFAKGIRWSYTLDFSVFSG